MPLNKTKVTNWPGNKEMQKEELEAQLAEQQSSAYNAVLRTAVEVAELQGTGRLIRHLPEIMVVDLVKKLMEGKDE